MTSPVLLVKNMVCNRCVMTVEAILEKLDIPWQKVLFGEIHLAQPLTEQQRSSLQEQLEKVGFELIDSHVGGLIEKIKQLVIKKARNEVSEKESRVNLSQYLSSALNYEYTHLSSVFSEIEGRTIENLFIEQRIEKAKELLIYGQATLSQIAFDLDYSSTAHLSSQFKKVTGLTPSHFKKVGVEKRKSLDKV
jgi:AraC family transcriptional regulator